MVHGRPSDDVWSRHPPDSVLDTIELVEGQPALSIVAEALLLARATLAEELRRLEKKVREMARGCVRTRLLMTAPGVGAIVGLTFVAAIDDPTRFRSSKGVGAHFGLTPRKYQSGETDITARISKMGDASVRAALYEAAHVILTRPVKGSALKSWAMRLIRRTGMKKAKVALARKLAVILPRMWIDRGKHCHTGRIPAAARQGNRWMPSNKAFAAIRAVVGIFLITGIVFILITLVANPSSSSAGGLHQPADPQLIPQGKRLLDWLYTLPKQSENKVISGQYHYSGYADTIYNENCKWVGLIGDSMIDGRHGAWLASSKAIQQQYIDYWNAGGIVTDTFKMHNPKTKGYLTDLNFTDADMDAAITPDTVINNNLIEWLDTWAELDQALEDNNVPLLIRPFHEMNCCFWYQNKDPQKMKDLWKYTFDYLTKTKGLHNLLFVYAPASFKHNSTVYYPGNDYVDIVGIDMYKELSGGGQLTVDDFVDYYAMQGYGKAFALTEFGPHAAKNGDTTAMADYSKLMTAIKAYAPDTIYWFSWSVSWSMKASENTNVSELLNDPWTITRDEIPNFK